MIEARKNKSINNSTSEIKEGIKPPDNWEVKINDIMPNDTISLLKELDSTDHRGRHTFTRTFIVISGRFVSFRIIDSYAVYSGGSI